MRMTNPILSLLLQVGETELVLQIQAFLCLMVYPNGIFIYVHRFHALNQFMLPMSFGFCGASPLWIRYQKLGLQGIGDLWTWPIPEQTSLN